MLLVIGGEKGGTGKSCLAQNLAVRLQQTNSGSVLLVDCDPQRTTLEWVQQRRRQTDLRQLQAMTLSGKIMADLKNLSQQHAHVVVDCGGYDNFALRSSIAAADQALIPLRPLQRDLHSLTRMQDMLSNCKMANPRLRVNVVLSQCPTNSALNNRVEDAKQKCDAAQIPALETLIYQRAIFDDSAMQGLSVLDKDPDGKAAAEVNALFSQLDWQAASIKPEPQFAQLA